MVYSPFLLTLNPLFPHTNEFISPSQTHSQGFSKSFLLLINSFLSLTHFIFIHFPNLHQNQKDYFWLKSFSSSLLLCSPIASNLQQVVKIATSLGKKEGRGLSEWFKKFFWGGAGSLHPPPLVIAITSSPKRGYFHHLPWDV